MPALFLAAPALLWLAVAFAAPLAVVLLLSLQADGDMFAPLSLVPDFAQFQAILGDSYYLRVLLDTLLVSLSVAAITAVLGFPLAAWLARVPPRWRPLAMAVVMVPLFTNVVVRTLGILSMLSPNGPVGWLAARLGLGPVNLLFGWFAVGLALVQVFLPFMVLALLEALEAIDPRVTEAARSLGAGPAGRFLTVTLPLCLPGLRTGLVMVFLMTATSYVSATILGGRKVWVAGMSIYQEALQILDYPLASALAVVLTVATLLIAAALGAAVARGMPWARPGARARPVFEPGAHLLAALDRLGPPLAAATLGIGFLLLLSPLLLVMIGSVNASQQATAAAFLGFTWHWYAVVFDNGEYVASFLLSLQIAAVAVLGAIAVSLPVAFAVDRRLARPRPLETLMLLPLALPGLAIGIGMLRLLQWFAAVPPFAGLVAVHGVLVLPFTFTVLRAAVARLDRSLEDAAAGLGASPAMRLRSITLPLLVPGLSVAAIIGFLISFGEVTVTAFLTTARFQTLPVRIYAEATFSLQNTVNAVSTLVILATCVLLVLVDRIAGLDRIGARAP